MQAKTGSRRPQVAFWFEFASTYTHLAVQRAESLAAEKGVSLLWRPFLLGPILASQGWTTSPFNQLKAKGENMWRDMERLAEKQGLPPITRPDPFPQNSILAARLATAMAPEARPAFARAVFMAEFAEGRTISDPALLAGILSGLGHDAEALLARAQDPDIKAALRAATDEAAGLGVFGAPSFVTEDAELFWGADRMEDAFDWAAARG